MDDIELAWAAGFFEGEGCVSTGRGRQYMYLVLNITQNNLYPLLRFQNAVYGHGKVYGPYTRKVSPFTDYHKWQDRGKDCWVVMELLRPYLCPESDKLKKLQRLEASGEVILSGGVRIT